MFPTDALTGEKIWGRGSCDDKSGLIGSVLTFSSIPKLTGCI